MNTGDIIKEAERRLRAAANTPAMGECAPSLRFAVHRLRPVIAELRRPTPDRPALKWAQIGVPIAESLGLPIDDPKMIGRVAGQYHHEKLSKTAAAYLNAKAPRHERSRAAARASANSGVETPGVRGPAIVDPFSI